jgi:hypothetical protein
MGVSPNRCQAVAAALSDLAVLPPDDPVEPPPLDEELDPPLDPPDPLFEEEL